MLAADDAIGRINDVIDASGAICGTIDLFGNLSHVMRKPTFWFPTWSDTNQAVQLRKMARGLKFRIKKVE